MKSCVSNVVNGMNDAEMSDNAQMSEKSKFCVKIV